MRLTLILLGIFMFTGAFSQNAEGVISKHSIKFPLPGYGYEQAISKKTVLNFQINLGGAWTQYGNETSWYIAPIFSLEPRYYYNFFKRQEKGKSVVNNAASYLALTASYISELSIGSDITPNPAFSFVPKWGTRIAMGQHFSFNFAGGIGIFQEEGYDVTWVPDIDLSFEYNF